MCKRLTFSIFIFSEPAHQVFDFNDDSRISAYERLRGINKTEKEDCVTLFLQLHCFYSDDIFNWWGKQANRRLERLHRPTKATLIPPLHEARNTMGNNMLEFQNWSSHKHRPV
jgi:hypothetical protein